LWIDLDSLVVNLYGFIVLALGIEGKPFVGPCFGKLRIYFNSLVEILDGIIVLTLGFKSEAFVVPVAE